MSLDIKKTYKLFIAGAFPRSESGRSYEIRDKKGNFIANPAQASRKDLRDAVLAAKNAHSSWASATAYNRGQILYRIAEIMEGRSEQFVAEIMAMESVGSKQAQVQVRQAIDTWVWYAGWSDKISTIAGSTNPVAGPFFNFTVAEPLGVVGIVAEEKSSLLGVVLGLAPVLAAGNCAVLLASQKRPLSAITLAECLATSDVPAGVVNILTGLSDELTPHLASHMEIDGLDLSGVDSKSAATLRISSVDNLKRVHSFSAEKSPERMLSFMEYKTLWHPIGV